MRTASQFPCNPKNQSHRVRSNLMNHAISLLALIALGSGLQASPQGSLPKNPQQRDLPMKSLKKTSGLPVKGPSTKIATNSVEEMPKPKTEAPPKVESHWWQVKPAQGWWSSTDPETSSVAPMKFVANKATVVSLPNWKDPLRLSPETEKLRATFRAGGLSPKSAKHGTRARVSAQSSRHPYAGSWPHPKTDSRPGGETRLPGKEDKKSTAYEGAFLKREGGVP
jgi:hypothetical protein